MDIVKNVSVTAILALVSAIVIGAMPGDKTDFWIPILSLCIISLIFLILATILRVLVERATEEEWTCCGALKAFIDLILNAGKGQYLHFK